MTTIALLTVVLYLFLNAVQHIIRLSGRNRTSTSSIDITLIYNLSIATIDIRGTATPVDGSSHPIVVTMRGPITTPELRVSFTGLRAGTTYSFVFEALSRDNPSVCLGMGINNLFLQTDHQTCPFGELVLVTCVIICCQKKGEVLKKMS